MDLFRGGPDIPSHLATLEFYELARSRLNRGGVLMVNVFDLAPGHPLLASIATTLVQAFPTLFVRSSNEMNHMVLAFGDRGASPRFGRSRRRAAAVSEIARDVSRDLQHVVARSGRRRLTDDRAPIERLTRRMMASAGAAGLCRRDSRATRYSSTA